MNKNYSPKEIEEKWYELWEKNRYFSAGNEEGKPAYTIVIPPPNVTGVLHMGHVLNNTIQDTLIRWKRMSGYNTLWMPGTDHAGIATQNKVERKLADEGQSREDLGREKFIEKVWEWKEEHGGRITKQLRRLGASLDWEKERFTMDEKLVESVKEIFIKLYNDDLVYRGEYMINWCSRCGTALADDEVEHEESAGAIWEIKYQIKDSDEYLVVATTRPETMLGDTGIAVNPNDERYKHLVGKKAILPLVGREIPIIADDYVDVEFGTGAVKMTPAHDPNDFEIGKRHNLEIINILNENGTINDRAGEKYKGQDRFEARKAIIQDLEEQGYLVKKKEHSHAVGHCYRCNTIVEPRVSKQWFVKMEPLAKEALEVVRNGKVKILPKRWEKVYYNWLDNIRDWCISRQIWWGHRIPAYYGPDEELFVAASAEEAQEKAKAHYGKEVELRQEKDVLDTWFSSWLWPFSTLGWPEKTADLEMFYPTSTLVTGADILFFWVARMVMAGLYAMDEIPFDSVFLHGIVRDEEGRKMSKSLGNSPDPIDIIDKYGADALRFSMLYNTSQGQDVFFSEKLIEMGRNFANKIWNASRFVLMNLEGFDPKQLDINNLRFELSDTWILSRLNDAIMGVNSNLDNFNLSDAAKSIYEFLWGDFCDWYVEIAKIRLYNGSEEEKMTAQFVLWNILEQGLRVLHPFMPFLTEEIWQQLPETGETIMLSDFPEFSSDMISVKTEENMLFIQNVIKAIRNIRTETNIAPGKKINALLKASEGEEQVILEENKEVLMKLANLDEVMIFCDVEKPELSAVKVVGNTEIYIPLEGIIDIEEEKTRLKKEIDKVGKDLKRVDGKLKNEKFISKAPKDIIEREKRIQKELSDKIEKLENSLKIFS
jgi:valyl-tRNA synthetase